MRDGAYWRRVIERREESMEVKSFREMSHIRGERIQWYNNRWWYKSIAIKRLEVRLGLLILLGLLLWTRSPLASLSKDCIFFSSNCSKFLSLSLINYSNPDRKMGKWEMLSGDRPLLVFLCPSSAPGPLDISPYFWKLCVFQWDMDNPVGTVWCLQSIKPCRCH